MALVTVLTGVLGTTAEAAAYPNDPYFAREWHLRRMGVPDAWKATKGKGVTIAIIDTGVDRLHQDLAANMSPRALNAIDGSSNAGDVCPPHAQARRRVCHGTMVAGTAAAVGNNGKGVIGVAPEAKIMSIAISDKDGGFAGEPDFNQAIMWAADNGAKVINMSVGLGLPGLPVPFPDIWLPGIAYATARGALVVVAAGNSAYPSCEMPAYNPLVLCVGASDQFDSVARFSNYGLRLDVVAPGTGIWTTMASSPTDTFGFFGPTQGTSFASPAVAGIAALLMSMGATNFQAASIIRSTAKDLGLPGYDFSYGFGRVSASAAVNLCKQVCGGGAR